MLTAELFVKEKICTLSILRSGEMLGPDSTLPTDLALDRFENK
jgi:hypothetical protein